MSASLDEASTGFLFDAPLDLSTNFYLLLGDNAYGYSSSPSDYDAYRLHLDYGSNYSVVTSDVTSGVDTDFAILDRYGNVVYFSTDYGTYSGVNFTALDSLYYVVTISSGTGFYGLRAENNSFVELNGIGEIIYGGQVYTAAIDYSGDSDHYFFNGVSGKTYIVTLSTSMSDLFS
jgi:hypothetical protein